MERNSDNEHRKGSQETDGSAHPAPSSGDQGASVPQGQAPTTGGQDVPSEGEGQGAEIVVGEIVGWRFWWPLNNRVPGQGYRRLDYYRDCQLLASLIYSGHIWGPGKVLTAPALNYGGLQAGIHAWRDRPRAFSHLREFARTTGMPEFTPENLVGGAVYLWGSVVVHEEGYRAIHGAIKSIEWAGPRTITPSEEWAAIYGVDYEPHDGHN